MRRLLRVAAVLVLAALAALAWLALALRPPAPLVPPEPGVWLPDVRLVEPGAGRREAASLRVASDRIARIGDARPGEASPYAGATVLPGLVDLHVHFPAFRLPGEVELTAFQLVAHGVTSVRVAAEGQAGVTARVRGAVEEGRIVGPRIRGCGPFVDGERPLWPNSRVVTTPDEARAVVAALAEQGVDCIKAYDGLRLDVTRALRDAADAHGLPLIGHTPRAVPFEAALVRDVQHLRGVHPPFAGERMAYPFFMAAWRRLDAAWLARVTETSLSAGVAHTPTLVTVDSLLRSRHWETFARDPAFDLVPVPYRDALWHGEHGLNAAGFLTDDDFAMVEDAFAAMKRTVAHLHRAGVAIHTGTDANAPGVVPGASLHRELRLLVETGLSPEEALALSTRTSANALGIEGLGRLREGAPADLLVFREDPTRDLAALDTLLAVVHDGRLLTRGALDAQQRRYHDHFHGALYRRVVTPFARVAVRAILSELAANAEPGDGG